MTITAKANCPYCQKEVELDFVPTALGYQVDVRETECEHCGEEFSYEFSSDINLEGVTK